MAKRINILLPEKTVAILDRVTKPGKRSRFIDRAVRYYVATQSKQSIREQLEAGYRANSERDLETAIEWFPLEKEAWETFETTAAKPVKKTARAKRS